MPTMQSNGFGFLDGNAIIKMNNLAVGYFPVDAPEIGVYPPPPMPLAPDCLTVVPESVPESVQHLGMNS